MRKSSKPWIRRRFFLDGTPETQSIKLKIGNLDHIKIQHYYASEDTVKKRKQARDQMDVFAKLISDKGFVSRIYKECCISTIMAQPSQKLVKDLNRPFSKEEILMADKYMKRYSTLLVIGNANETPMQMRTLCTHYSDYDSKSQEQILERMWRNWDPYTLLVGM